MQVRQRVAEILRREAEAILAVRVTEEFERAIDSLRECEGKVVTIGMGKAGVIARKLASTLCSTGTPAMYLHPGEAAHGDLGLLGDGDCVVAFSTSGETREVIEALQLGRKLARITIIAVTSHPQSTLREIGDILIDMGPIQEPCPLGLTPSASTAVMHAIGDALALVLMELKGTTQNDFGLRHHGGYLGRRARVDE